MKNKYSQAVELIKAGKIEASLRMVENISFDRYLDFIFYCKEKQTAKFSKALFWLTISKSKYSSNFFNFSEAHFILSDYFNSHLTKEEDKEFILWLADNYPDLLIKCMRVSRLAIHETNFRFVKTFLLSHSHNKLKTHLECMSFLENIEKGYWQTIEQNSKALEEFRNNPLTLLNLIALWFEMYPKQNDISLTQECVDTLSFGLEYLIINKFLNNINEDFTEEDFMKSAFESLLIVKKTQKDFNDQSGIFLWLSSILFWIKYYNNLLEVYFYDLNFQPEISNEGALFLKPNKPELLRDWYKVGYKNKILFYNSYQNSEAFYKSIPDLQYDVSKHADITEFEFKHKSILKLAAEEVWLSIFDDFFVDINKESMVNASDLLRFFNDYSGNCYTRWSREIDKVNRDYDLGSKSINADDIFHILRQNLENNYYIGFLRHDYFSRLIEFFNDKINADFALNLFVADLNTNNSFNRFNIGLNLWETPFLKFGNNLLAFSSVMADTRPHTFIFNNLLYHNRNKIVHKNLSEKFENKISKLFKQKGFNTNSLSNSAKSFANPKTGENGDIDCLAYKDGYLFIIEAKLASMRETLGDSHMELSSNFVKAASQLNKINNYIKCNFQNVKTTLQIKEDNYKDLNIIPLIVSTSFENDKVKIYWGEKSFLKISWYELSLILTKESDPTKIISNIKNNDVWKILDALPNLSITNKTIIVGFKNPLNFEISSNLHSKAIELFEKEKFSKAIPLLKQAIVQDAEYADTYVVLADCYAYTNQLKEAEKYYLLAIEKDPYYAKAYTNYGVFLQQNKRHEVALHNFVKAFELEPNASSIREYVFNAIIIAKREKHLSEDDFEKLNKEILERLEYLKYLDSIKMF